MTGKRVTPINQQIGLRLRTIRVDQGVSQDALAEKLGISFQQIQKYESGKNRLSLPRAIEVAQVLKTTVNELIGVDGTPISAEASFNYQTFKLAQSFERLQAQSPELVDELRRLIDKISEASEVRGGKKRRR